MTKKPDINDEDQEIDYLIPPYDGLEIFENLGGNITIRQFDDNLRDEKIVVIKKSDVDIVCKRLKELSK